MENNRKSASWSEVVWVWTIAIVIGHIYAYSKDYFGIDQLIPCVIGYPSIAVLINSMLPEKQ